MREPHKRDEPTAYRDPGPTITTNSTALAPEFSPTWCYLNPALAAAEIERLTRRAELAEVQLAALDRSHKDLATRLADTARERDETLDDVKRLTHERARAYDSGYADGVEMAEAASRQIERERDEARAALREIAGHKIFGDGGRSWPSRAAEIAMEVLANEQIAPEKQER